jgi:lipopolysaccharide transport system permease protein
MFVKGPLIMSSSRECGAFVLFADAWRYRQLLRRLIERDVALRFRGAVLGKVWVVLPSLAMLALYTFVFGVIFQPRWPGAVQRPSDVALYYFAGLIVFEFFMECINRAPNLMPAHATYIKKILFPVELFAWMVVGGAALRFIIGCLLLVVLYTALHGIPPATAMAVPLLVLPLALFAVGAIWFLSAIGVFVRDASQVVGAVTPAIMFLSPVFFPLGAIPEQFRIFFYANPLTLVLENVRAALFAGSVQISLGFGAYCLCALAFAQMGYHCFRKLRPSFADVI